MMFLKHTDTRRIGRPHSSPLRNLKIGETYFWAGKTANEVSRRYHDLRPMRFSSRTVMVNGVIGTRVRRIA